ERGEGDPGAGASGARGARPAARDRAKGPGAPRAARGGAPLPPRDRAVTRARIAPRGALTGEARVPGDKSITQRAILLGALAPGTTRVRGANTGEDARAALAMARQLGARVTASARDGILIRGGALRESDRVLDARNSGTALRLLTGLLAAQPFLSILSGDSSLR